MLPLVFREPLSPARWVLKTPPPPAPPRPEGAVSPRAEGRNREEGGVDKISAHFGFHQIQIKAEKISPKLNHKTSPN